MFFFWKSELRDLGDYTGTRLGRVEMLPLRVVFAGGCVLTISSGELSEGVHVTHHIDGCRKEP